MSDTHLVGGDLVGSSAVRDAPSPLAFTTKESFILLNLDNTQTQFHRPYSFGLSFFASAAQIRHPHSGTFRSD